MELQLFLAHIPAGYVVSKVLLTQFRLSKSKTKLLMCLGILGSTFPDLDMFYFYLIDNRQHGHHSYWTHTPFYWILLLVVGYGLAFICKSRVLVAATTVFIGCVLLHMMLDTFAGGGIKWFYPFSNEYIHIFSIPSRYNYWVWNYIFHWTALAELLLITLALATFWSTRKQT